MTDSKKKDILLPKNQTNLFGYEHYFSSLISLFEKKKLPSTILLNGQKGSGKATFAHHFINYLLSINDKNKYSLSDFSINTDNINYKYINNDTHPNFFLLDNLHNDDNIKIDKVRSVFKFLNQSTYSSDIKIILIDSIDCLNIHSSNALLKVLEEANHKTFFFLINNNPQKILNTIRSRCIEFKFFFSIHEKKRILRNLIKQYSIDFDSNNLDPVYYFDSPGNLIKYLLILDNSNVELINDKPKCILHLLDNYKQKNDPDLLKFISFLIELFFNELSLKNTNKIQYYFFNKIELLKKIDSVKKFNLDKKNLFLTIRQTIENESK